MLNSAASCRLCAHNILAFTATERNVGAMEDAEVTLCNLELRGKCVVSLCLWQNQHKILLVLRAYCLQETVKGCMMLCAKKWKAERTQKDKMRRKQDKNKKTFIAGKRKGRPVRGREKNELLVVTVILHWVGCWGTNTNDESLSPYTQIPLSV